MKKKWILLFIIPMAFYLYSCSSAHKVQGINLNGTWILNSVKLEGVNADDKFKTTLFDDVSSECFAMSSWSLLSNGNGSYTIQPGAQDCKAGTRTIYWSVQNDNGINYLQFKKLNDGTNPKDVKEGYKIEISSVSGNSLVMRSPVNISNKNAYIVYNFTRQ